MTKTAAVPKNELISEFNLRKYQNESTTLVDGTEYLANVKEQVISFQLESTGKPVYLTKHTHQILTQQKFLVEQILSMYIKILVVKFLWLLIYQQPPREKRLRILVDYKN